MTQQFPISRLGASTTTFGDPEYVDPDRDSNLETARVWTMHLRTVDGADFIDRVLDVGPTIDGYLGHMGGDQWEEWCEKAAPGDPLVLHVYFGEMDVHQAVAAVEKVCSAHEIVNTDVALSTAQDFAEQVFLDGVASPDTTTSHGSQFYIDTGRRLPEGTPPE